MRIRLHAQCGDDFPYLKKGALTSGEVVESSGIFGVIPFTDAGEAFWNAVKAQDRRAEISLSRASFRGVPWEIRISSKHVEVLLSCERYFRAKPPESLLITAELDGDEKYIRRVVKKVVSELEHRPWKFSNEKAFESHTDERASAVKKEWTRLLEDERPKKKEMPETVDVSDEVGFEKGHIVYTVVVNNQTSRPLKKLDISLEVKGARAESPESTCPRLSVGGSFSTDIVLVPEDRNVRIAGTVSYLRDKERREEELKDREVELPTLELTPEECGMKELRSMLSDMQSTEVQGKLIVRPPDDVFEDLLEAVKERMYVADTEVDRKKGTFRGTAWCHSTSEGKHYCTLLKVMGAGHESRVNFTHYAEDGEGL